MRLSELAATLPGAAFLPGPDPEITRVTQDSRSAGPGALFVAVRGLRVDGHGFAAAAAAGGAALAVEDPSRVPAGAAAILLPDTRRGLSALAAATAGFPARRLLVAGITGTDGKTTTTHMAAHLLEAAGRPTGWMSTVAFGMAGGETHNSTGQSTADADDVQRRLAGMLAAGAACAVVEATSHALDQGRVAACEFDVAAFTNIGSDHLDYHPTWEHYAEAKAGLIDLCAGGFGKGVPKTAVLNRDDVSFERLAARPIERRWTYSLEREADFRAVDLRVSGSGSAFRLVSPGGEAAVELAMPARFNAANALCAAAVASALGVGVEAIAAGLSGFRGVRGRLEPVDLGQPFRLVIDFAHSAGSLAHALGELRPHTPGRLIAVFGSTARSDHDRPGMGRAAAQGADFFLITTDDPVAEDPAAIAADVESGVEGRRRGEDYDVELDRRAAIRRAVRMARPGDTVLLAGKGHERTMLTAAGREPWDERAEAEAALREEL